MKNLETEIAKWVEQGFITPQQAIQITEFETLKRQNSEPGGISHWSLLAFTLMGVFVIGLGILSVIASNWELIPNGVKLVVMLSATAASGFGFIRCQNQQKKYREGFLALTCLLILASIGLVGQIFNLDSSNWKGLGFWLVLTVPLCMLTKSRAVAYSWFLFLWITAGFFLYENPLFHDKSEVSVLLQFSTFLIATGLVQTYTVIKNRHEVFLTSSFPFNFGMLCLSGSLVSTLLWYGVSKVPSLSTLLGFLVACVLGAAINGMAEFIKKGRALPAKLLFALLLHLSLMLFVPMYFQGASKTWPQLWVGLGGLCFVAFWTLVSLYLAVNGARRLFYFSTLLVTIRFVFIFLEALGSLAISGLGLIFSGMLIVGFCIFWSKNEKKFFENVKRIGRAQ